MRLVEISEEHIPTLYEWRNSSSFLSNCTSREPILSVDEFVKELQNDFKIDRHQQFLIEYKTDLIGTIYTYSYNDYDKYCFSTVYINNEYANKSFGIKSFVLLAKKLFDSADLYKLYFDIYEYNRQMLSVIDRYNFSKEGVFRKQHLKNGIRYDVYRFAFYKKDLPYWIKKLGIN